jgi:hypothetical protein
MFKPITDPFEVCGVYPMNRPIWGALLFCFAVAVAGCSKSGQNAVPSDKAAGDARPASGGDTPVDPAGAMLLSRDVPKRSSLEGRWAMLFYQRLSGMEVPAALLDISKSSKDTRLVVKVKQFGAALSSPTLKAAQAGPQSLHLVIELAVQNMMQGQQAPVQQNKQADILVELHDGFARGSAQFGPLDTFLVALVPTQQDIIQELHPQPLPEAAELNAAKDKPEEFLEQAAKFVKAHPDSPMTVEVYPALFMTAQERKLDKAAVESMADDYMKIAQRWGSRTALKARIDIASALVKTNYLPQMAMHQLDLALGQLTEETIPVWRSVLEQMKDQAKANEALAMAHKGTPEERAKAIPLLRQRDKEIPYDPIVLLELARFDDEHGKAEDALKEYAKLTVLPLFDEILQQVGKNEKVKHPSPRDSAEKIWKGLHGGKTDGFDKYLDDIYAASMPKYTGKPVSPRPADPENRVVLCELFTGADCGYCVAADVAFAHLLKTYSPSEVVALQYHEHIPQPDPLANQDTEARFRFYFPERGGTPTFTIDGLPAQRGGLLHQAGEVYASIRSMIDRFLTRKTTVRIQLAAQPKGNLVAITADAEGSFPPAEPIRLRMALAEERIAMRGSNGIREHEMVVRSMPGGPQGVEIKDGKLHYHGTVDLKSLRQELNDQLIADEEKQKAKFSSKPLELTHLRLVAFVQNDESHEIYQSKMVEFPTGAAATADKKQATQATPQPAAVAGKKP